MSRLGALSTASVGTPILLLFFPELLSEDKWQAVNFLSSHGLSVTHTQSWKGWAFECFQGRVNMSGLFTSDV